MTEFYTNCYTRGDKILVRGYEDGVAFSRKVDFQPTMFVNSNTGTATKWSTLYGAPVHEIKPGSIKDTRDFLSTYEDVEGFGVHGNSNYIHQYISETYPKDIEWDTDNVKLFTVDIETSTEFGFPNIETANEEITLISLQNNFTKNIITFGCKAYNNTRKDVTYHLCNDEQHLLKEFLVFWQQNYPDALTGWNVNLFDVPYIINRIRRVLGETSASRLSPWNIIKERRVTIRGREEISYDIAGVSVLDYLDLYRKFTYTTQESYKLDHIAGVELNEGKLDLPGVDFKDSYTNHWQIFVDYNIRDVELVDRLEDKMKLIELIVTMAYNAKINYEDVFSPVKMWDAIIYNHLLQRNIVVPQKSNSQKVEAFEGAFVKDPIIGAHNWVASFDLASLYPHLIMQYNISPETMDDYRINTNVDQLLAKEADLEYVKANNLALTANGVCYRKDVSGFLPELMEKMYQDRSKYKKQMLAVQQEFEKDKGNNNLRKEISRLYNMQMAGKIALNSLYGALGNSWFRYFDLRMAEGITTSGQLSIRWMADRLNAFMNKTLKTEGEDFVIAIDTDSIYLALGKLVEKTCPNKTTDQTIKYLDRICTEVFMPFIDKGYQELAEYMNAYQQKMQMKREVLADKAIWTAKKRYILNVHNSEGVQYAQPKLKVVGLEVNKSSTPAIIRKKLKDTIQVILNKTEPELQKYIADFRAEFNAMPIEVISFPRGVNNLKQYTGSPIYGKATPIAVRAALLHNHYIKKLGLTKQYQPILEGSKIKFIYLNPQNPIREDVIGYIDHLPKEFGLHEFIDYDKMFDKVYVDAVKIILDAIGWDTEHRSSLEDFF